MIVYEIRVEMEDDNTGMKMNSFVDNPAVKYGKLDFSEEVSTLQFSKDNEQKFTSVSLLADTVIPRKDPKTGEIFGVVFTKESIINTVNKLIIKGNPNDVRIMHKGEVLEGVYLVEHFITREGVIEAPAFKGLTDGSWVTTYYVEDKAKYEELKADPNFNGFSTEIDAKLERLLFKGELTDDDKIRAIISSDVSDEEKEVKIKELIVAIDAPN